MTTRVYDVCMDCDRKLTKHNTVERRVSGGTVELICKACADLAGKP